MSGRTQDPERRGSTFIYEAFTLFGAASQLLRLIDPFVTPYVLSYNPKEQALWFGLFPVRSPLLRKSNFLSLPAGTEMFQFPASAFT